MTERFRESPEIKRGREATITIKYEIFSAQEELYEDERLLLQNAREAMANAHSPYSRFDVGAAVKLNDGSVVVGNNQENAAYPSGLCAERTALFYVGTQGKGNEVQKLAVIGTGKDFETTAPVMPCGGCRQVIKEYQDLSGQPIVILASGATGDIYRFSGGIDDLLPLGFGPKDLGI